MWLFFLVKKIGSRWLRCSVQTRLRACVWVVQRRICLYVWCSLTFEDSLYSISSYVTQTVPELMSWKHSDCTVSLHIFIYLVSMDNHAVTRQEKGMTNATDRASWGFPEIRVMSIPLRYQDRASVPVYLSEFQNQSLWIAESVQSGSPYRPNPHFAVCGWHTIAYVASMQMQQCRSHWKIYIYFQCSKNKQDCILWQLGQYPRHLVIRS